MHSLFVPKVKKKRHVLWDKDQRKGVVRDIGKMEVSVGGRGGGCTKNLRVPWGLDVFDVVGLQFFRRRGTQTHTAKNGKITLARRKRRGKGAHRIR